MKATQRLADCSADMQRIAGAQLAGTRMMIVGEEDACKYDVLTNGTLCIPANFKVEVSRRRSAARAPLCCPRRPTGPGGSREATAVAR